MAELKKPSVGFKTAKANIIIGDGDLETEPLRVNINFSEVS